MNDRIKNAIERARSGKLSKKELGNLRNNALRIGDAEELILVCDEMLSKLPTRGKSGGRKSSVDIAEKKDGYNIVRSAYTDDGILRKPELVGVAEELAKNNLVSDISILKTQIKLYYRGRHFTADCKPDKSLFWVYPVK